MYNKKLIEQIYQQTRVSRWDIERVLNFLTETQIVTYTYADPDGANFHYPDLDELVLDMGNWDELQGLGWPIHAQIQLREPVCEVVFKDGVPHVQ